MVKAFSTSRLASHSLMASSASACSSVLIAGALQPRRACSSRSFMHSQLLRRLGFFRAAQAQLLQAEQVLAQLRGGALGGRAGIVQLVHQAGGERAQRDELFAMQRLDLVGLQALRAVGQNNFAHRRDSRPAATRNPAP